MADSIFASSDREQPLDINGFSHFSAPNSYLAVAAQTAIGISAQTNSAGHFAPSAETEIVAPVPEPSTWLAGIALALLVGVRCVRSKWRRRQQRTE